MLTYHKTWFIWAVYIRWLISSIFIEFCIDARGLKLSYCFYEKKLYCNSRKYWENSVKIDISHHNPLQYFIFIILLITFRTSKMEYVIILHFSNLLNFIYSFCDFFFNIFCTYGHLWPLLCKISFWGVEKNSFMWYCVSV